MSWVKMERDTNQEKWALCCMVKKEEREQGRGWVDEY